MSRRTTTSSEVKDRYNRKTYDFITFRAAKHSLQAINELAESKGLSRAAYLRSLIIHDAVESGRPDIALAIGIDSQSTPPPPTGLTKHYNAVQSTTEPLQSLYRAEDGFKHCRTALSETQSEDSLSTAGQF